MRGLPSLQQSRRLARNNFDLLRLLFAGTVCLVHAFQLSGFAELGLISAILSSDVAVQAFFVLSGFLVFMSFERSESLASYARKRTRRIYPAYFTVVVLCAFGLWAVSAVGTAQYFSTAWLKYLAANLAFLNFLQPTLPGVFDGNKVATVNGALWTLKIEVMFYMAVPFFVLLFRRFGQLPVLIVAYCASVAYAQALALAAEYTGKGIYLEFARQLPGQLSYFMAGAFFYYFLPLLERRVVYFLAAAVSILAAGRFLPVSVLEPFALGTVVIISGLFLYAGNFGKYGDFSYGVYILHFPIIQLLLHSDWFHGSPWLYLLAVVLLTMAGAVAMWHLIEKRFLFRSSHYISATSEDGHAVGEATESTRASP